MPNGAELLVAALENEGVERGFGVPVVRGEWWDVGVGRYAACSPSGVFSEQVDLVALLQTNKRVTTAL